MNHDIRPDISIRPPLNRIRPGPIRILVAPAADPDRAYFRNQWIEHVEPRGRKSRTGKSGDWDGLKNPWHGKDGLYLIKLIG